MGRGKGRRGREKGKNEKGKKGKRGKKKGKRAKGKWKGERRQATRRLPHCQEGRRWKERDFILQSEIKLGRGGVGLQWQYLGELSYLIKLNGLGLLSWLTKISGLTWFIRLI